VRILIPLDGSPLAEKALEVAEPLALAGGLELLLLRVVPVAPPLVVEGRMIMTADEVAAMERRDAEVYLAMVAAGLRARGLRVRRLLRVGDPARAILAAAEAERATLIAMATHGRGGLGRLLFGSVTARVMRASPIPVLTVRPEQVAAAQVRSA